MKAVLISVLAVLTVFVAADRVHAQVPFDGIGATLRPGDVITVTDESGDRTRGRLEGIGSSIRLSVNGVVREWSPHQVREIRRRGDSLKNGLTIGMISGGVVGTVFGLAAASLLQNEGHDAAGPFFAIVGLGVGIGAGIGVGLDASIPGSTVVYRQPRRTVSLSPAVTPTTQSLRVAIAF
jgi:hypothetical protein